MIDQVETTPVGSTPDPQIERTSVITATPSTMTQASTAPSQTATTATTRIDLTENDTPPSSSPSESVTNTETPVGAESQPTDNIEDTTRNPTPEPTPSEPADPSLTIAVEEGINAINALLDAANGIPVTGSQSSEISVPTVTNSMETNTENTQATQSTEANPVITSDTNTCAQTNPVTASVVQDNSQSTESTSVPITGHQPISNSVSNSMENVDSVVLSNSTDLSRITPESSRSLNTPPVPGSIMETAPSTVCSVVTTSSISTAVTTLLSTSTECISATTTSIASSTCGTNVTNVTGTTCANSIVTSSNLSNVQTKVSVQSNMGKTESGHVKDKTQTSPTQTSKVSPKQKIWNPLDGPRTPKRPGMTPPDVRYPHPRFPGYSPQQTMRHPYPPGYPMGFPPGHPMAYPRGPMLSPPHPAMGMEQYPGVYPPGMMGHPHPMMGPGMMPVPPHMMPPGHPMAMQVDVYNKLTIVLTW